MFVFILLLMLIALALGIFAAVIKVATFIILTMFTVVAVVGFAGYLAFKWQVGKIAKAVDKRLQPPGVDDRY